MKPSTALHTHHAAIRHIILTHRASNLWVFGSALHGDATEQMDLDILVDPSPETTSMDVAGIQVKLEALLGVAVDVFTPRTLPAKFRSVLLAECVPV